MYNESLISNVSNFIMSSNVKLTTYNGNFKRKRINYIIFFKLKLNLSKNLIVKLRLCLTLILLFTC